MVETLLFIAYLNHSPAMKSRGDIISYAGNTAVSTKKTDVNPKENI